jgi:signal peptidase I
MTTKHSNSPLSKIWREWIKPILAALIIVGAVRSTLADWNDVPTGSMKPTILEGDRIFVNKLAYDLKVPFTTWRLKTWSAPARGDIVVLFSPEDGIRLVKRVIGLPGDRIELVNNQLQVNGNPINYEPLSSAGFQEVDADERAPHVYGQEFLGTKTHPIMITPLLPARRSFAPLEVPAGQYYVMGDNRDNSKDSRYFGCVRRDQIIGQALGVALSFNPLHYYLPRWHRFFTALH